VNIPRRVRELQAGTDEQPQCLTRGLEGSVRIDSVDVKRNPDQEWFVGPGDNGNITIERPSDTWPNPYLTYDGKADPTLNANIITRISDSPLTQWQYGPNGFLRVAGSDLGIGFIALSLILGLVGSDSQLLFNFEPVPPQ